MKRLVQLALVLAVAWGAAGCGAKPLDTKAAPPMDPKKSDTPPDVKQVPDPPEIQ